MRKKSHKTHEDRFKRGLPGRCFTVCGVFGFVSGRHEDVDCLKCIEIGAKIAKNEG